MERLMRWYVALICSLLVFYVTCAALAFLFFGTPVSYEAAPLRAVTEWMFEMLERVLGSDEGVFSGFLLIATPAAVVTSLTYGYLRRPNDSPDGHLHCLKCGYILKGLSEPRCPECGERI